jgi:hypothetical protein
LLADYPDYAASVVYKFKKKYWLMFQKNTVEGSVPSNHNSISPFDMYIIPEAQRKTL